MEKGNEMLVLELVENARLTREIVSKFVAYYGSDTGIVFGVDTGLLTAIVQETLKLLKEVEAEKT